MFPSVIISMCVSDYLDEEFEEFISQIPYSEVHIL